MTQKAFLTTLPDFAEVQRASFCWFLSQGLIIELEKFSAIDALTKTIEVRLNGREYKVRKPRYSASESKNRNVTYSIQLYAPVSIRQLNQPGLEKLYQKTYICVGELPLMTDRGTFIINGCERVIINQIIRSPGVYFTERYLKAGISLYAATIVPRKGSWVKFEIDKRKALTVHVDKTRPINIANFIQVIGSSVDELLSNVRHPDFVRRSIEVLSKDKHFNVDQAEVDQFFNTRVFNRRQYDLGIVGRYKLNTRCNLNFPPTLKFITKQDILTVVDTLINLDYKEDHPDDIDHLQNRRVRSVGELVQLQFNSGLDKIKRAVSEQLSLEEIQAITINDVQSLDLIRLLNARPINSTIREFFGSSQLSQFLDQTNPLAELTHRRRITGLGPGGFNKDHVSFAVRDIHPSHYGRLCPIETPEGQNAGLISSLSIYARVNTFGFIETPFLQVRAGIVLKKYPAIYLTAEEEDMLRVAAADTRLDKNGKFINSDVTVRYNQEFITISGEEVQLIAVSPIQVISPATALIPFLEHDDANRALMGSNMQRQAVPLLHPTKPIVGTGLENQLATDAGMVVISYIDGQITNVTNDTIYLKDSFGKESVYNLQKYTRSNQDTCINQRPIVWPGEYVTSGQIIADGPGTDSGETALGQNVTVAYMPWEGYNYEDALLINERLVYSDLFTSIHIEKYDIQVRETQSGIEELTIDIPNVSKDAIKNLDENGVIQKGKFVNAGDILVGKITPIDEEDEIPEDRLLRAIFGEKRRLVNDSSLRVHNGSYGRVLDIRVFSRENGDSLSPSIDRIIRVFLAQMRKIQIGDKMAGRHGNKGIISRILPREDMPYLPDGTPVDLILNPLGVPSRMNVGQLFEGLLGFAGDNLDIRFKVMPFDEMHSIEASRILINNMLLRAQKHKKASWIYNDQSPGKILLRDGRTGDYFDNPITICTSYMLKLVHLVDDKIHARSTGPYSLVTQQPLGGRSQHGGQRLGEMEVWALEAFGAAYTLQELLTIKSDDIDGRNEALAAIIKDLPMPEAGIPESFKVLILELRSLCLDVSMYHTQTVKNQKVHAEVDIMLNKPKNDMFPRF